jgi:hypothetical protein
LFDLKSNPEIPLQQINSRRFDIIDRAVKVAQSQLSGCPGCVFDLAEEVPPPPPLAVPLDIDYEKDPEPVQEDFDQSKLIPRIKRKSHTYSSSPLSDFLNTKKRKRR